MYGWIKMAQDMLQWQDLKNLQIPYQAGSLSLSPSQEGLCLMDNPVYLKIIEPG
jgi:hypothetical protein